MLESELFIGKSVIMYDIEGFEITEFRSEFNYKNLIKPLNYGYKFVCWNECESFDNIKTYFRKNISENKFSHNYKIFINQITKSNQFYNISPHRILHLDSHPDNKPIFIDSMEIILEGIDLDNNTNFKELILYYCPQGKNINSSEIKYTLSNGLIKIDFSKTKQYWIETHSHIGLEFITNSPEEFIKNKLLLRVKKIILSNKE